MYKEFITGFVLVCYLHCSCGSDNANVTTSSPSNGTTSTTTVSPPTTTPPVLVPEYYNVTRKEVLCIMIDGDFSFNVTYASGENKTMQSIVNLPKPWHGDAKVDGNCTQPDSQWIKITWGLSLPKNSLKFTFNTTNNGALWHVAAIDTILVIDSSFDNATETGAVIQSSFKYFMNPMDVSFNGSYNCHTPFFAKNETSSLGNSTYEFPIWFEAKEVQLQAFNLVPRIRNFMKAAYCTADKTSDVLPTIVGSLLCIFLAFVIFSYLFGPKRRNSAYQPI